MAWSREINAEHFVGVSAGSQIGAMGPWDPVVGATADFTPRQLIIVFGPGGLARLRANSRWMMATTGW
jgi:hypothetical protein